LPSNASLGKSNSKGIYKTYIFPAWKVCYGRTGNHPEKIPILYNGTECPVCKRKDDSSAVRFIVSCINGHLDDVNWNYAIHYNKESNKNCNFRKYYYWKTGGSSLSDIIIQCPKCGSKNNMGNIYNINFKCSGRLPERESPSSSLGSPYYTKPMRNKGCDKYMKVLQRQSSSLRIPETITLLTIPKYDKPILNILQKDIVAATITAIFESPNNPCKGKLSLNEFVKWIKRALNEKISQESIQKLESYIKNEGISNFCKLFKDLHNETKEFIDFIFEEFDSLTSGPQHTYNFKMGSHRIFSLPYPLYKSDLSFKVFPIERLRTITAQIGYIRIPYLKDLSEQPKKVDSSVYLEGDIWYPGFEGKGEGIFITFPDGKAPDLSRLKTYKDWNECNISNNFYSPVWRKIYNNPLFVWLHTFSHAIIMTLSIYSGYSSASLRERVYINREKDNGGILIYTTSPGQDGSMGGLTGSIEIFDEILEKALERIKLCSNDPLCSEIRKVPKRVNGAACYSCLLISETSCEHRNTMLDRHIVLGD